MRSLAGKDYYVDPKKTDSFEEFICWDGLPMVNQGFKFYK